MNFRPADEMLCRESFYKEDLAQILIMIRAFYL